MSEKLIYTERVSSDRTEALFVALMLLFFGLLTRRLVRGSRGLLTAVFFFLGAFFLFYTLNYRTLVIRLTAESLSSLLASSPGKCPWRMLPAAVLTTSHS